MAEKTLLVVESPTKIKTISKYLGKNYVVESSVGHIKDLESFRLGVDVKNDFKPKYVTIRGKGDVIKKLNSLAKSTSKVLIATDPDREGEAIAWHIAEEVKKNNKNIKRVLFNEITKSGIEKGLSKPQDINNDLFMSQQARRVLDRLIGYKVSPFLSRVMIDKTTQTLSAGRVQSVALRMICEREEEITGFVPIDYWSILGTFETENKDTLKARLVAFDGATISNPEGSAKVANPAEQAKLDKKLAALNFIRTEKQANELCARIRKERYTIKDINRKKVKRNPQPPFTTSSLQQEASRRLGFSNKKTMTVAQRLYEGVNIGKEGAVGLITYMRTDSVRLSPEAQTAAQKHIVDAYGKDYLPAKSPEYSTKSKNVQDAHEAIRPTSLEYTPKEVRKYTEKDLADLYELIFNRFLASQMNPAVYDQTSIDIQGGKFIFRVTGSVLIFKGFLAVYDDFNDEKNGKDEIPNIPAGLTEKQLLNLNDLNTNKSQTKPPARYNSASLVKELDERGIGRPSTYATIIGTLQDRKYIELEKKSFQPTELGKDVNVILVKNFPDLFNVAFTADMELSLDLIAEGKKTYLDILKNFYGPFSHSLELAENHGEMPEIKCDKCGAPMVIKVSRRGRFLACSAYPECKNTKPLPKDEKQEKAEPEIAEGITCDICSKPMFLRSSRFGKFYGCTDYPKCKGTKPLTTGVKCPKCSEGAIVEKFSPKSKKKFFGCSRYPDCDYITKYEPVAKKCPSCGNSYLEIHFKKKDDEWVKYMKCPECKGNFEMG